MSHLKDALSNLFCYITEFDGEAKKLSKFAELACRKSGSRKVLDVGCGYGRNMKLLLQHGFDVSGVDINENIFAVNRQGGLRCLTIEEFSHSDSNFDLLLMSHVIEHFGPSELMKFIDGYLDLSESKV